MWHLLQPGALCSFGFKDRGNMLSIPTYICAKFRKCCLKDKLWEQMLSHRLQQEAEQQNPDYSNSLWLQREAATDGASQSSVTLDCYPAQ